MHLCTPGYSLTGLLSVSSLYSTKHLQCCIDWKPFTTHTHYLCISFQDLYTQTKATSTVKPPMKIQLRILPLPLLVFLCHVHVYSPKPTSLQYKGKVKKFPFKLPSAEWGPPQSGNGLLHFWALRSPKRRLRQISPAVCPTKPELFPNYHSSFQSFHWSTIRLIDRKHTQISKKCWVIF